MTIESGAVAGFARSARAMALCAALSFVGGCCQDGVRTESVTFTQEEWLGMLESVLSDISLRLNNYTSVDHEFDPSDTFAFYHPNDSSLNIESLGITTMFDIPVERQDPYSLYVNDVRTERLSARTQARRAVLSLHFEDDGQEIIGNCVDNVACICGDPRIDLNDMVIDIFLSLGARGGQLVFTDITASMASTFEETGPCRDNVCAFACDLFAPNRESQARAAIEDATVGFVADNQVLIEAVLNQQLRARGVEGEITLATLDSDGTLTLVVKREDPTCA